jgi:hypothetical protein
MPSFHIDSAVDSLEHIARTHAYGVAYENESDRNHVDGLLDHAFDHVMKAETFDNRGDYKSAHSALTTGTRSAMKAIDMIHNNSVSYDLTGHKITLDQSPTGYKNENFS